MSQLQKSLLRIDFRFSERKFGKARRFIHSISRRAITNLQLKNGSIGQMWTFVTGSRNIVIVWITVCLLAGNEVSAQLINLINPLTVDSFDRLVKNITNFVAATIGGLAVLAFVWAAIVFLTSRGEPSQVEKAKKVVLYAVIGLTIALLGSALIDLVRYIITGV